MSAVPPMAGDTPSCEGAARWPTPHPARWRRVCAPGTGDEEFRSRAGTWIFSVVYYPARCLLHTSIHTIRARSCALYRAEGGTFRRPTRSATPSAWPPGLINLPSASSSPRPLRFCAWALPIFYGWPDRPRFLFAAFLHFSSLADVSPLAGRRAHRPAHGQ